MAADCRPAADLVRTRPTVGGRHGVLVENGGTVKHLVWLIRLAGLFVLLGLVAACAGSVGAPAPKVEPAAKADAYTGGPRLAFDNQSVDFGQVPYQKEVTATFHVKNVGDQKLTIGKTDVKVVQGC